MNMLSDDMKNDLSKGWIFPKKARPSKMDNAIYTGKILSGGHLDVTFKGDNCIKKLKLKVGDRYIANIVNGTLYIAKHERGYAVTKQKDNMLKIRLRVPDAQAYELASKSISHLDVSVVDLKEQGVNIGADEAFALPLLQKGELTMTTKDKEFIRKCYTKTTMGANEIHRIIRDRVSLNEVQKEIQLINNEYSFNKPIQKQFWSKSR